jgi:ankyrin repeat protein
MSIFVSRHQIVAGVILVFGAAAGQRFLYGETSQSLFEALRQGDIAKVREAVNNGADVNSRDTYGNTLLMQTAVFAREADLAFLLAHGADVNAANNQGHTAIMRAMPDLAKVKLLVEHGASVNTASVEGITPVVIAASIPSATEVLRYLIQKGGNVDVIVPVRGGGAVMRAAAQGAVANLKLLLDAGADGRASGKAAGKRNLESDMTPYALERVAKAQKNVEGTTALMAAANSGCDACVRLLLARGAEVNARNGTGLAALHGAAFEGNPATIRQLLESGAEVNVADARGFTPLMMAVNSRTKNPEGPRLLLAHGAETAAKDSMGRTAADWSRIGARPDIMKLLQPTAEIATVKASTEPADQDIHAAMEASVGLLQKTAPNFFRNTGCISCHNVSIPMMALTEARRRGYAADAATSQRMVKEHAASLGEHRDNLLSGACTIPGMPTTTGYAAIAMHGEGYLPDLLTDGFVHCLLVSQEADGRWHEGGARPPLSPTTPIPATALAARVLKLYVIPAFARDVEAGAARARTYLLSAKPVTGDDYAYRLLGLLWTGAKPEQIATAARELWAQQRSDGGWAQAAGMQPDAYASGLSLSALAMADSSSLKAADYRRGVDYLMRNREADGSWRVRTRAFGFQPYFESGFPHGQDQWISMAATAWSAIALLPVDQPLKAAVR